MSRDIIVLTPNGRRQKIHCTPDTSILQVLEEVCQKHGYEPTNYDLKHYNKVMDLTNTIRFSNLPNKATLEMVEAETQRKESEVTVALILEDGERKTGQFLPNTSLYQVILTLAPAEINSIENPSILYTRQEVTGITALEEKTLRQLGLLGGRAILRLLNKSEEARQANVSAVYGRRNSKEEVGNETVDFTPNCASHSMPGPSYEPKKSEEKSQNFINLIKKEKSKKNDISAVTNNVNIKIEAKLKDQVTPMEVEEIPNTKESQPSQTSHLTQDNLERRLKIEQEVTFVGQKKAIVFMRQDVEELDDLPDDFYELTIEEVRRLYNDLQQQRIQLENTPLMISTKKEEMERETSQQKLLEYKNAVVRIQFPDQIILQGVFDPTDTIQDVYDFVKEHIEDPREPFYIFTTPFKESLDPKKTLFDAKFVPCVHMHFKFLRENAVDTYLKKDLYLKQTSSDAAGILASKYRAPKNRGGGSATSNPQRSDDAHASTSRNGKFPKWLKS